MTTSSEVFEFDNGDQVKYEAVIDGLCVGVTATNVSTGAVKTIFLVPSQGGHSPDVFVYEADSACMDPSANDCKSMCFLSFDFSAESKPEKPEQKPEDILKRLNIRFEYEFVPYSQAKNRKEFRIETGTKHLCWIYSMFVNNRLILSGPYMAGSGHCPSYKASDRSADTVRRIEMEIETGKSHVRGTLGREPILPKDTDVFSCVLTDGQALEQTFEEWARDLGLSSDSIKAKSMYDTCVEIGIKMNNAIGSADMSDLRKAFANY